ncbi:MAG TPA: L-threonylcarbamoyladenylate synthase [Rhizomicrobium sp.]|nr:L-threonylcarbamoyladenylate synthase [Rhizomicrobium sp.]
MNTATANLRAADDAAIEEAAGILRDGGLVAFPTETVYGLGADATNDRAVAAIFAVKERPRFNPLIVHVADTETAKRLVVFTPAARWLAERFWPGALTLVLPRQTDAPLSLLVSAGLDTVAVRVPSGSVARKLIAAAGVPIAAPSANASGEISPTTAEHVRQSLGNKVDLILDGGPTRLGLESTVIGFDHGKPVLLRPGSIARVTIEAVAGPLGRPADETVTSPGQLASHYAPDAKIYLNAISAGPGEVLLAFGPTTGATRNLSPSGDLEEAAGNLFAMLRELDAMEPRAIAVMPIPDHGLGEAINDRLRRAAAPRGLRA